MARRRYTSNEERIAAIAETLRHDREKALHEIRNAWQLGLSRDIPEDVTSELESIVTRRLQMPRRGLQFARYLQASPFWDLNSIDLWYLFGDFTAVSSKFLYGLRELESFCRTRDEALAALSEAQLERRKKKIKCPGVVSGVEWSLSDLKRAVEAKKKEVRGTIEVAQAGRDRAEPGSEQLAEQSEQQGTCRPDELPLSMSPDGSVWAQDLQTTGENEQATLEEDRSGHGQVESVKTNHADHSNSLSGVETSPQMSKDQSQGSEEENNTVTNDENCDISFGAETSSFCLRSRRRPTVAREQEEQTVDDGWEMVSGQDTDITGEHRDKESASEQHAESTGQHSVGDANSQHEAEENTRGHQDGGSIDEHEDDNNSSDHRSGENSSEHTDETTRQHHDEDTAAEHDERGTSEHDEGITFNVHDEGSGVFSFDQDRGTDMQHDRSARARVAHIQTRRISGISEHDGIPHDSALDSSRSVEVGRAQAAAFQAASEFSSWLLESSRGASRPLPPHLRFAPATRTCWSWKARDLTLTSVNTDSLEDGNRLNFSQRPAPSSPASFLDTTPTSTSTSLYCSTPKQALVSRPTPPSAHQQGALHKSPPLRPRLPLLPSIQFPLPLHPPSPQLLQLNVSAMSGSQAKRRASPGSSAPQRNKRARMPIVPTSPPAAEWQAAARAWLTSFMPNSKTFTTSVATAEEHFRAIANLQHTEERRRANYGGVFQFTNLEVDHAAFIYINWQDHVTYQCATTEDPPSVQTLLPAFTHHFHLLPLSIDASENLASVIAIATAAFGCDFTPPLGELNTYLPPVAGLWVLLIEQWYRIMLRTDVNSSGWNAEEDDSPLFSAHRDTPTANATALPDADGSLVTSLADALRRPRQTVEQWNMTAGDCGRWRDEAHNAVSLARRHISAEAATLDRIRQQIVRWEEDDDDSDDETLRMSKVDKYRARAAESESRREKMQCWAGYVSEAAQQYHELWQDFLTKAADLRRMCQQVLEEEMAAFAEMP